jgi:phosphatidylserine/phosphatidylglycerophosphate/cardiolipin synthase-like enzyme/uncharacterized membrane protein YdjX (TVP38/TMEM64 family)
MTGDANLRGHVILQAGRNVWRVEKADRAAILVDAGRYFAALREALLRAQSTVFILGWDLDTRTRLVGESGTADDGFPEPFMEFLGALVERRPALRVYLLVWDYSVLYAFERELLPALMLRWRLPRGIRYCLDDDLPLGAAHHQKIVVIDDAVAFSGGLDVTVRRWDTTEHRPDDPRRIDQAGAPYSPFHDVQAMVDGRAARALAELVRERWLRAACEQPPPIRPKTDPWPETFRADFTDIDVGIARTLPGSDRGKDIREVEALFFDTIRCARESIYIENQFLTAMRLAECLARHMLDNPRLEAVFVTPKTHHSWVEAQAMQTGRVRFMRILKDAGLGKRIALLFPQVSDSNRKRDTLVHSKVMAVDDVLLRIGSANLNNRSFGLDTECDLALEAANPAQRHAIGRVRDGLIGHHCGVSAEEVAAAIAGTGSLVSAACTLSRGGHSLEPVEDDAAYALSTPIEDIGDPERPISPPAFLQAFVGERPPARRIGRFASAIGVGIVIIALMLVWRFTPLAALADPRAIADWLAAVSDMRGAVVVVPVIFVVAGLFVFPVTLLIAATAAAFGPWFGFLYAGLGAVSSAVVGYGLGTLIGKGPLEEVIGPRLNRVHRSIARRGVIGVAAVRLVPVAPFTLVNLAAGASQIAFTEYVLGTVIGMAPGLALMAALGHQIFSILASPTWTNTALFVLAVLAWIAVTIGVQALVLRWRRQKA